VDSCMDEIPAINARERPIVDGFVLPDGITLLYATSDAGAEEFIGPAAMRLCDRVARRLMRLSQMPASVGQPFHLPVPVAALGDGSQAKTRGRGTPRRLNRTPNVGSTTAGSVLCGYSDMDL
jgi:hypothetical protein